MTVERLQNYLGTRLPLVLNAQQHFRLLRTVFALVFLTTLAIHFLVDRDDELIGMLTHAVTIALVYVIAVGLATTFLYAISGAASGVRVWHVWLASLSSLALGYYVLPIDDGIVWLLGSAGSDHAGRIGFSQLLPVWFVLTYIFVQPYLSEGLALELSRLRDINRILKQHQPHATSPGPAPIHFEMGRTEFTLKPDSIRNVVVEDHYCYVHYRHKDAYEKRDLAMPLRDVLDLLPDEFLRVHRSHVINLKYINTISRKNRKLRIFLDGNYEVPVSRHRLEEVLPLIRAQIER